MPQLSSLHRLAFEYNAQASIIASIDDDRIIAGNKAACELLGYSSRSLLTKSWLSLFKPREGSFKKLLGHRQDTGQGHGLVCVKQKSGKVICCDIMTAVFTDEKGIERTITTLADRSGSIRLQRKIDTRNKKEVADNITIAKTKQRIIDTKKDKTVADDIVLAREKSDERFQLIFNSSSDVLYDIDLVSNLILLSDAYEKEFGYRIKANMSAVADWANHIHPDDKDAVIKNYTAMLHTRKTEWKYSYRFLKADQSVATVLSSAIMLRTLDGKAYRMIGSMQDISKQTVLEATLKTEVRLKERQIAAAMLESRETERSDIGKELHDNVNQLLGVSRLYLDMAKKGGGESGMYLSRSSEYTLTAIEEIRKLTKGLTTDTIHHLGLGEAIRTIARDTMEVNTIKITCLLERFDESNINEKVKLNLYRMVQEQLNNILKHAHASAVTIMLRKKKGVNTLTISDNGNGFDTTRKRSGIGLENIKSRAALFGGQATILSSPGKGCTLTVTFSNRAAMV